MLLLKQLIILFLIMMVGFICRKRGLITDEGSKVISALVVNVANPALILSAGINGDSTVSAKDFLYTFVLALIIYIVLIVCSFLIPKILRASVDDAGVFQVMTVFSNIGFMGFPVVSAVYGSTALLYASIFVLPYNILIYTWGIAVMSRDKAGENVPADGNISASGTAAAVGKKSGIKWKNILNVGVIACILTLIIYLGKIPLPSFISSTITSLSNMTSPLSMIVIGDSLALLDIKSLITDKKILGFSLIKLIIIPIIVVLILKGIGISTLLAGVCMVMMATPVGSMTALLAQTYDCNYELASKGVALTTVLCVVTMPIVSMVLGV